VPLVDAVLPELLEKPPPHPASKLKKKMTKVDVARTKRQRERGPMEILQQLRPGMACFVEYSDGALKRRVVRRIHARN
jgi:hypothetical protein